MDQHCTVSVELTSSHVPWDVFSSTIVYLLLVIFHVLSLVFCTMEEEQEPGNVAPRSVTKKKQYPADFKLQVISSAKTTNNTKAAKMHGVDVRCVRRWKQQEKQIKQQICEGGKGIVRMVGGGRNAVSEDIEELEDNMPTLRWVLASGISIKSLIAPAPT